MQISSRKEPAASTASSMQDVVVLALPVGAILKQASGMNNTRSWEKVSIVLCDTQATTTAAERQIGLVHEEIQAGSRYVTWRGEITIESPFIYLIAQFGNCTAADECWLIVGYEMPKKKVFPFL